MFIEIGLALLRLWMWGCALLLMNSISMFAFTPSLKRILPTIHSILCIPVWPLALFSIEGRTVLFNRIQKL
jgi:hypothetical protein